MSKPLEHIGGLITQKDGVDVIECAVCEFKHIMPLPTPEAIKSMYEEVFYSDIKPSYISKMEREKEYWMSLYTERIEEMNWVYAGPILGGSAILDIGCGPGYFMAAAAECGLDPVGVELSLQASKHARQFGRVYTQPIEEVTTLHPGTFHMVHMSFILEHLVNPHAVLRKMHKLMPTGGVLCIEVPRDFTPLQEEARQFATLDEWWVAPTEGHVNYFSSESLKGLVSRNGFSIQYETTSWPMELYILAGRNYVGHPDVGKKCHEDRMGLEKKMWATMPETKKALYAMMARHGIGREIILYCRREDA